MPEADERLLARIGEALECAPISLRPLSGSILNTVHAVRCGEHDFVAKFGPGDGIRREAAVLTMLQSTEVPVPHVTLLPANSDFPHDLLLLGMLPGNAAEPDSEVLANAGGCLRRLHDMPLPGFGPLAAGHQRLDGTSNTWAGFVDGVVTQARQTIPVDVMSATLHDEVAAQSYNPRLRAHFASIDRGVLLHGDLVPKHVWDDRGRLAGLIDWGDAMVGDPLYDLARFSMSGRDPFNRFRTGYDCGTSPDALVLSFYRIAWSLMALTVECDAGGDWVDGYVSTVRGELRRMSQVADVRRRPGRSDEPYAGL